MSSRQPMCPAPPAGCLAPTDCLEPWCHMAGALGESFPAHHVAGVPPQQRTHPCAGEHTRDHDRDQGWPQESPPLHQSSFITRGGGPGVFLKLRNVLALEEVHVQTVYITQSVRLA